VKLLCTILIVLAMNTFRQSSAAQSSSPNADIQGTWELSAQKTANRPMVDASKSNKRKEIKLIVDGHFVWTVYDVKRRTPDTMGGGTYTLAGDSYIERLEFASPTLAAYVGHEQKFTVKLDGARLIQTGVLSDGTELQEIWERIR
jgi:hypothetical protein